ncbi:MAG: VOC family protein [Bacteroidales bacterium]|nr:VOC family protein [Bacteroidales bacterium]
MKRKGSVILLSMVILTNSYPQAPELYNKVNHLLCVVEDIRTVKKNWQQLGFTQIKDEGEITILSAFSEEGEAIRGKMAIGYLDDAIVVWIQTSKRGSPFSDYMHTSKEGVYSLVYAVDSKKSLKKEAQRLKEMDINILDNLEIRTSHGKINYYLFNTAKNGKYVLGFLLSGDAEKLFDPEKDGSNLHNLKFAQYAFAIADETAVSDFWYEFGLPDLTVTHDSIHDKTYYGNPGVFDIKLGWQRHGDIPFEWCIPLQGPNVYEDHMETHKEGLHHIAFETEDIDNILADYKAKGFVVSQSGGWGKKGQPGSGRFAYLDPKGLGGITIELLWNYR